MPLEDVVGVLETEDTTTSKPRSYSGQPKLRTTLYDFFQAGLVGSTTGLAVVFFKFCISKVRTISYGTSGTLKSSLAQTLVPTLGGLAVALLALSGPFSSGMREMVQNADRLTDGIPIDLRSRLRAQFAFFRKVCAAVFTLGTGCSLGPEGPCVEIGMDVARACMDLDPLGIQSKFHRQDWNRMLLSCGAAAGVAAGFNAPIAGVFFSFEILKRLYDDVDEENKAIGKHTPYSFRDMSSTFLVAPLLVASVVAASTAQFLTGDHLVLHLNHYNLRTPSIELPLYVLLGTLSGFVAVVFDLTRGTSARFFKRMSVLPPTVKPILGGLICGLVALRFPQILFFGYSILDPLLSDCALPTMQLLNLLFVKMVCTAVSSGSGLIGGTFAPALVLGALTGGFFHNVLLYLTNTLGSGAAIARVPAYAMVGSASVLGALFRAPLTAALLVFEATRDYNVILPLLASSGIAVSTAELLHGKLKERQESKRPETALEKPN